MKLNCLGYSKFNNLFRYVFVKSVTYITGCVNACVVYIDHDLLRSVCMWAFLSNYQFNCQTS
jgi:hypothetical protein